MPETRPSIACPLCGSRIVRVSATTSAGLADRLTVECVNCTTYLIESSILEAGSIPEHLGRKLAKMAWASYRADGSPMIVTQALIQRLESTSSR